MTNPDVDVAALAKLARLDVSDDEISKLKQEIPHILEFVATLQKASAGSDGGETSLRNVMRADENPHESGKYTKVLLEAAPARDGNRVLVKQVVSRKK
ncbi:MAG: aspartyl/glutamyl-tRNA amidotransferase subunit C [Candidatus Kaiserbacteria bacterium]|nr:MAG: aspartyl/glutamyl-tRNA amidotransferase subunit C [Candidatus Kaiserbacteria bacterium]